MCVFADVIVHLRNCNYWYWYYSVWLFEFFSSFHLATLFSDIFVCVEDILSALEAASGRKHPSTVQVKQLKTYLPLMPVLRHFVTSPVRHAVLRFYYRCSALLWNVFCVAAGM